MAPKVDPTNLIDAQIVAEILGLNRRSSVSVYRMRYHDFPEPVVDMGSGRCLLWLRGDVERWVKART